MKDSFEILLNSKYAIVSIITIVLTSLAYICKVIWSIIKQKIIIKYLIKNNDSIQKFDLGKDGSISIIKKEESGKKVNSIPRDYYSIKDI